MGCYYASNDRLQLPLSNKSTETSFPFRLCNGGFNDIV